MLTTPTLWRSMPRISLPPTLPGSGFDAERYCANTCTTLRTSWRRISIDAFLIARIGRPRPRSWHPSSPASRCPSGEDARKAHPPLEISLQLLLLHRARGVTIDGAALSLGAAAFDQLCDDRRQSVGLALDRPRQGVAAKRAEADLPHGRQLAGPERQAVVVHHDEHAITLDHRTRGGQVEGHHRQALSPDVLPHIELGPV